MKSMSQAMLKEFKITFNFPEYLSVEKQKFSSLEEATEYANCMLLPKHYYSGIAPFKFEIEEISATINANSV